MDGTFLLLTGFRSRTVPISAVDTVWPKTLLLQVGTGESEHLSESPARRDSTDSAGWADETLAWWELLESYALPGEPLKSVPNESVDGEGPVASAWRRLDALVSGWLVTGQIHAVKFVGWARVLGEWCAIRTRRAGRRVAAATTASLQVLKTRWNRLHRAAKARGGWTRVRVARSLFDIAVWIDGDRERLVARDHEAETDAGDEASTDELP
jgi:hypothetical protein